MSAPMTTGAVAYDKETVAPSASRVFCSFSASSFGTFSLSVWGHDSTNFFAWRGQLSDTSSYKL